MRSLRYLRGSLHTMTWLDRAVVLSVALLLSLQLMFSGQHKDNHVGYGDNCASCVFAHHLPSGLPDVDPVALPPREVLSYHLEGAAVYRSRTFLSFLIPESQAPPRA